MKLSQMIIRAAAAALAACAAFYLILKYWSEISLFFGQLRDKIALRCTCCGGSDTYADDFDEVGE